MWVPTCQGFTTWATVIPDKGWQVGGPDAATVQPHPGVPRWISDLTRIWSFAAEMTWKQKKRMNRNISTVMPSNAIYKGVITPILFVCHSVETVWFCIFKVCQERLGLDGLRYYREDGSRLFFLSFLRVEVAGEKSMKWVCQKTCFFFVFFLLFSQKSNLF